MTMSDRKLDRRDFMRLTGAGALGLGLAGGAPAAIPKARAKSVIQIYLEGGMTHIDTLDPKPNASPSVRSFFKPIPTNVPGTEITELLPLLAQQADKYTLLRSVTAPGAGTAAMSCSATRCFPTNAPARTRRRSSPIPPLGPWWG